MKILALVVLLALPSIVAAGPVNRMGASVGSCPWASLVSTSTQMIESAAATQGIYFSMADSVLHGITQVSSTVFSTDMAGVYEMCFSGIADNTSGSPGHFDVFLVHNGIVANSNTSIDIPTGPQTSTLTVCLLEQFETNGRFEFRTHSSQTTANWKYIAAETDPVVPASPSVIVTVKMVDGD